MQTSYLDVERVVVCADSCVWSRAIETRQRACKNGQLLSSVVANDTYIHSHASMLGFELDFRKLHVFHVLGIELEETKVMNRVSIDCTKLDFFTISKNSRRNNRSVMNNMPICKNDAALLILRI
jgi:hypothetical protein